MCKIKYNQYFILRALLHVCSAWAGWRGGGGSERAGQSVWINAVYNYTDPFEPHTRNALPGYCGKCFIAYMEATSFRVTKCQLGWERGDK